VRRWLPIWSQLSVAIVSNARQNYSKKANFVADTGPFGGMQRRIERLFICHFGQSASYLSDVPTSSGDPGRFSLEIIEVAVTIELLA
jgi:hypothetical protein